MEDSILVHAIRISVSIDPAAPAWKAWRLMKNNGVSVLPVISDQTVVGLVTHQDILRFANQNGGQSMPVKDIMHGEPLVVHAHESVKSVINSMMSQKKEYAIIVDESGRFQGVYNWTDAMQLVLNHG